VDHKTRGGKRRGSLSYGLSLVNLPQIRALPRSCGVAGTRSRKRIVPTMDQLTEKVLTTLASVKHIPRERIFLESSLQGLGFDSLDRVTMLFEIEKQFQISVSDEDARSIQTVSDIVQGVARLVAQEATTPEGASE
jgi:acyl carrier protein